MRATGLMGHSWTRRAVLIAGMGIGLSGCLGKMTPPEVTLDSIFVRNLDDSAHTVSVRIRRADEIIIEKTVTAGPKSSGYSSVPTIAEDFPESPATYQLQWSLAQQSTVYETQLDPEGDSTCIQIELRIGEEGGLSMWGAGSSNCDED